MEEARRLALLDNQRADKAASELLGTGGMRVVPEAASIVADEVIVEVFTRQHRCLGNIGHAVHLQRQTNTMPVDGALYIQLVDEAHPQTLALAATQLQPRRLAAITPGRRHMPRHQLQIKRCGDQLVVVGHHVLRAPEPVAHTTCAQAGNTQASQTGEHLSTGKRHLHPRQSASIFNCGIFSFSRRNRRARSKDLLPQMNATNITGAPGNVACQATCPTRISIRLDLFGMAMTSALARYIA